ncbi:MAG: AMP-binding protein, partial [Actinobacteria bacterium]|nr:AMP-binding protein [Actinomycetota bacterium]NIS33067.1 AMP-binding protein [Actinomycetota bacterium]NIT96617.1 AMP-binding protein [Actinomycetota bacterium]NIU20307.1 AMP-binding protein [Actinomycetota bacterium]NIU67993.1 AMP-binding protein [Actinomycetota bacterium]
LARGDRVGIVVLQSLETGIAHLAVYKLGAVALPLAALFGPDSLRFRMGDAGASAVITTVDELEKVIEATAGLDVTVVVVGDTAE